MDPSTFRGIVDVRTCHTVAAISGGEEFPTGYDSSVDFVWPVPNEELDACEVIALDPVVGPRTVAPAPPRARVAVEHVRHRSDGPVANMPATAADFSGWYTTAAAQRASSEPRRASLAVVGGLCCAVLAYVDLRTAPREAAQPIDPTSTAGAPRVQGGPILSGTFELDARDAHRAGAQLQRAPAGRGTPPRANGRANAGVEHAKPTPPARASRSTTKRANGVARSLAPASLTAGSGVRLAAASRPEPPARRAPTRAGREGGAPPPAAEGPTDGMASNHGPNLSLSDSSVGLAAHTGAGMRPSAALPTATDDADGIRSTLTNFRTAYSTLNAKAARAVWPTVDERALARAFGGLKSQEIAFDNCDMVVRGTRASAACQGRATYVPRVGRQSPRTDAHEWTFTLKKVNDQWTIDSAGFRE